MSKQLFIQEVEKFQGQLSEGAREYFQKTLKAKKVNKKEVEKATAMKSAIVSVLSNGKTLNRVEIMALIEKQDLVSPEYLYNDKDELSYNSITAFANQLVAEGNLFKQEVREGKAKVIKYRLA